MNLDLLSLNGLKAEEKIYTVSEFLDFLNEKLIPCLSVVRGEVGEKLSIYPNFTFFDLLDKKGAILRCFVWKNALDNLGMPLTAGMKLDVFGYPEIRKDKGELKFQVKQIRLVGEGDLKKQFEILKKELANLGYFSSEVKKSIPRFCEKIGLITSRYGKGAKKDFETHLGKFGFEIFFYDARMEGNFALDEIIEAINWFNQNYPQLDVLVLTRGGGDWESLHPFNTKEVVKAIRASKIPIITGIGHEDDETLADLASDLRASTPTHAAKILNDSWKQAKIDLPQIKYNLNKSLKNFLQTIETQITLWVNNLTNELKQKILTKEKNINNLGWNLNFYFRNYFQEFKSSSQEFIKYSWKLTDLIKNRRSQLQEGLRDLLKNKNTWVLALKKNLTQEENKLRLSSPLLKLKQGYTITSEVKGGLIKDPRQLKLGQEIKTQFYRGKIISKIKNIDAN
ncbi:MAG: exodeoxyribonuclease VII large subunit [Candidatus Pacebacteria bacterium]|nr:exodeoxyribonuclease VII large subunit [Candidatus Paceibacterota bacterium]